MLATPFAALAGIAWGVLSANALAGASPLFWASLGGFSFAFLIYLELLLVPPLAALSERMWPRSGFVTVLAWEGLVVGGLVFLLTRVLGAPAAPAIGTALGVGAAYTFVMEYVLCGSAAADFTALLGANAGRVASVPDRYSSAEALIRQGRFDEAVAIYTDAVAADPRTGSPYLGLARALSGKGEHEEALASLRRGRVTADLPYDQTAFFVRQIAELCATKLGRPSEAEEDLTEFLALHAEGAHAEWAARELEHIDHAAGEDSEPGDGDSPALGPIGAVERFDPTPTTDIDPDSSTSLRLEGPDRLNVDDDFRPGDEYDVGEGLVLEEDLSGAERYADAWTSETEAVESETELDADADELPRSEGS